MPSPLQSALSALIVNVGNVIVAFGVFDNKLAATVETAVIGVVTVAFLIASELRHRTNTSAATALQVHTTPPAVSVSTTTRRRAS